MRQQEPYAVGVISDTHGELPPGVAEAFRGVDLIVHAGDIDRPEVLEALGFIAPVRAVRGNMDGGSWAQRLAGGEVVEVGEALLYVLHDLERLDLDPAAAGFSAVIHGHTHAPLIARSNGVLYLNPGSASRPRSSHRRSVALVRIAGKEVEARIVPLG